MSVKSPVKKIYSNFKMQESLKLLRMPDPLPDSNILCSKKTYGKMKDYRNLSISYGNGGYFPAAVSEQLENNGTSLSSKYSELHAEENMESVASYSIENSYIPKDSVNSEISLFNDEDTDYYFSVSTDSPKDHDSFPSTPEASSSCFNYQRTRKNLKNQLSNQQSSSEETSESTSHEENSNSLHKSKSASNFLNLNQSPSTKQNSLVSIDNPVKHTTNGIKASAACIDNFPKNPILFQRGNTTNQTGKTSGIGSMSPNPSKKSSGGFSLINLFSKYAASSSHNAPKTNPSNKRKRIQKECQSVSAKKTCVVKHSVLSKVNSVEKKLSNSTVSVGNYNKSDISTVGFQGALETRVVKSPSKAPKHYQTPKKANNATNDNVKGSVDVMKSAKKGVKTPSKASQEINISIDCNERSIQVLQKYVSKNKVVNNYPTYYHKVNYPSSSSLASSDSHLIINETVEKIQSDNGDKQIEKPPFMQTEESKFQNQELNNIPEKNVASNCIPVMPMIIAPIPPISREGSAAPLYLWAPPSIEVNSIRSADDAVPDENMRDISISQNSTLNKDDLSVKISDYYVKNLHAEETTTTTTTTIINQTDIGCNQKRHFFRPRTHINDGIEFKQFMANRLKNYEDSRILKSEGAFSFFSMNPSMLNITVKEFLDTPSLTNILLDYVNKLDMGKHLPVPNSNKGYDFPDNFENESLLRVAKDFVHSTISYIIPDKASKPIHISYSQILNAGMLKMSSREFLAITQVFEKTDKLFHLKDVCARLSYVALFVIFDEYRNRKRKCG